MVTEHVSDKEALGAFIYHLCNGKDTYRLRRRATRRRECWACPRARIPAVSSGAWLGSPRAGQQCSQLTLLKHLQCRQHLQHCSSCALKDEEMRHREVISQP